MRVTFIAVAFIASLSGCVAWKEGPNGAGSGHGSTAGGLENHKVLDRTEMVITLIDPDIPCTGAHGPQSCVQILLPNGETELLYDGIIGLEALPTPPAPLRVARVSYDPEGFPMDIGTVQYQYIGRG